MSVLSDLKPSHRPGRVQRLGEPVRHVHRIRGVNQQHLRLATASAIVGRIRHRKRHAGQRKLDLGLIDQLDKQDRRRPPAAAGQCAAPTRTAGAQLCVEADERPADPASGLAEPQLDKLHQQRLHHLHDQFRFERLEHQFDQLHIQRLCRRSGRGGGYFGPAMSGERFIIWSPSPPSPPRRWRRTRT